jgi:undecaprenyl pyrophosphate phosphatase UppP
MPMTMATVDSKPMGSLREDGRRNVKSRLWVSVALAVFVAAVIAMALRDGAGGAALTALVYVAAVAIAFGLWGTAMAVRESQELGSPTED